MFDHRHYVPVLRWKQAEWEALKKLRPEDAALITPLVEITPRSVAPRKKQPTLEEMLAKNAKDMWVSWGPRPLFVDLMHLDPAVRTSGGLHPLLFLAREARRRSVLLVPATGLDRAAEYQQAVRAVSAAGGKGVCLRLFRVDIERPSVRSDVQQLLSKLGVTPHQVDLIVDLQVVGTPAPEYAALHSRLPYLADWRSFTVAGGAFPPDLQGVPVGQQLLPRLEWQAWRTQVSQGGRLQRQPAFADYAIQHPIYAEPPERANFSASIRYTLEKDWLIMRGEGVFHDGSPGFAQWPANAQLLCERTEFRGANFSSGDAYIFQRSLNQTQTGSPATWLQAGFNHHLTFVARQIASLFGI